MELGFIGLGRMGLNMVRRLSGGGHRIFCTARTAEKRGEAEEAGAAWVDSLTEMAGRLAKPRAVWIMVPAGETTETVIGQVASVLEPGDLIVDGGNSDYRDSRRRAADVKARGVEFIDCGTSGGIWGLQVGYCLMIGGTTSAVERLAPVFTTLAPPDGWLRVGSHGAGHFVKMVHNAVEYGMMQAMAEGFSLMEGSGQDLNLHKISHLWNQGSVVRSWLMELAERMFAEDPHLERLKGFVEDSGECRWAIETALAQGVPAPVFSASLFARYASRRENSFENRCLAALRNQFGGHAVKKA